MASRTKKDANDALDGLRNYLCRDRGGIVQLESISRYLGELRHDKTKLTSENERLKAEVAGLVAKATELEAKAVLLSGELTAESSRRRQSESTAALTRQNIQALEDRITPTAPADLQINETKWWHLFKDTKRRIPTPPSPAHVDVSRGEKVYVFELADFIRKFTSDEFLTLGQFVALFVACSFPGRIGFEAGLNEHDSRKLLFKGMSHRRQRQFFQWMHTQWIQPQQEWKKALLDVQSAVSAVVDGEYVESPPYPIKG